MEKDVYMTISSKTKQLLVRQEGFDVDFKLTVKGIRATDFVAFANSQNGGTILAGVGETEDAHSMQRGRIVGCPVGDQERLYILSKAESCVPPIEVQIIVENYARKPFYRIEIPPGKEKPYSTAGGTYKIRGDGRTNTLLPGRLLTLFMENQSDLFLSRFREATRELGQNMLASEIKFQNELQAIKTLVYQIDDSLEKKNHILMNHLEFLDQKLERFIASAGVQNEV
ncbi:ATP-binding protein [Dehalobacter sp. DCM]|uniref:AlbA family DNA-binding domain-containing protein n=1 Tax=Dehalobacter sp. DCM TaxID=2907827 RepID=UPI003081BC7C|nr:ATP-binding protein [Dehalobacter sp. DCM]